MAALQQTDLSGGIPGGAGADRARLQHQHVLAGASKQNRGHQSGDPRTDDDDIGTLWIRVKVSCSPRLFDAVAEP
ncbi:hypothetical protein GCM10009641_14380 [Mycobacterium cookii]